MSQLLRFCSLNTCQHLSTKIFLGPKPNQCLNLKNPIARRGLEYLHGAPQTAPVRNSERIVGKWLLGCSAMVFGAVALGGVTRLTESGLSMVRWNLLGEKFPRSQADWLEEFERYKKYPEFQARSHMTVDEFKFIYMMEYIHRMWGRAIGGVFLLPAVYFWKKGYFNSRMKKSVTLMGLLLGFQGGLGWYMVKSGLEDRFQGQNDIPRVSQYRLASHLGTAFVLYSVLLSSALSQMLPAQNLITSCVKASKIRPLAHMTKGLVFLTAVSGAFVAGLDAGLVYNSFPKMGDDWVPKDILALEPKHINFTENPTTVQFDHRVLGISTVALISAFWLISRRTNSLPKRAKWALNSAAAMAWLQATLGVTTLLEYVPVPLATAHQSGSLILLSLAIWLSHELRFFKYIPK